MPRLPRQLQAGYAYHMTTRCNNREFRLTRLECREVFIYALKKCQSKFNFKGKRGRKRAQSLASLQISRIWGG